MHSFDNLELRAIELDDTDMIYEIENDVEAWKYGDIVAPISKRILEDYALTYDADPFISGQLRLIIQEINKKRPIGIIDLYDITQRHKRAFVGIYILKKYRYNGLGGKSLNLIEEYAKNTLHLNQLGAKIDVSNKISLNLFEKKGFIVRGILPQWIEVENAKFTDLKIYSKFI